MADAPEAKVMDVCPRMTPSMCPPVPTLTVPVTTQTMLLASAPPTRTTLWDEARVRVPATWKIHAEQRLRESTPCA